jgi:hypothetical protein
MPGFADYEAKTDRQIPVVAQFESPGPAKPHSAANVSAFI